MDITSTQLKQKQGEILREAMAEPIKISLRGKITHVLMSIKEYEKLLTNEKIKTESK